MEGIVVDRPENSLLCDVQNMFVNKPDLEDPVALVA
jgi:hypothetical protein